jgi:hypothetical protein
MQNPASRSRLGGVNGLSGHACSARTELLYRRTGGRTARPNRSILQFRQPRAPGSRLRVGLWPLRRSKEPGLLLRWIFHAQRTLPSWFRRLPVRRPFRPGPVRGRCQRRVLQVSAGSARADLLPAGPIPQARRDGRNRHRVTWITEPRMSSTPLEWSTAMESWRAVPAIRAPCVDIPRRHRLRRARSDGNFRHDP